MKTNETTENLKNLAEGLIFLAPLPDITPLQKIINNLYLKLRICGMPAKNVSFNINELLKRHNISTEDVLRIK